VQEATENDCYQIIRFFDTSSKQSLKYKDFLSIIMPCEDHKLRLDVAQREIELHFGD
jgi:hypothetical protein